MMIRSRLTAVVGAAFLLACSGSFGAASAAGAVQATGDAAVFAEALRGSGVTVTGAVIVAAPPVGATIAVVDSSLLRMPTSGKAFATMSTGSARRLFGIQSPLVSSGLGGSGSRGNTARDVTVVRIDFTSAPGTNCLTLDTRFMSEEYPEFPGKIYNDGFVAELDINDWTTLDTSILAPHNFAFRVDAPASNGEPLNVRTTGDASATASNARGSVFDGGTPLLRSQTPVSPGAHSLYLSILDQGDDVYDSVVMLDRLTARRAPRRTCGVGASPLVRPTLTRPALVTRSPTTRTYGLSVQSESRLKRIVVKIDGRTVRVRPFFSNDNRDVRILVPVADVGLTPGRHTMTFDVANRAGTSSARLAFTS